jgi:hypothetical protein
MDPNGFVVKDKTRLLTEVMTALAGDAYISFEGNLSGMSLSRLPGCSTDETATLKRNTSWPQQDFIVLPLEPSTVLPIMKGIGGTIPNRILHIQIDKNHHLEFAAYDNFHPGCVVLGAALGTDVRQRLISTGILRPVSSTNRR